MIEQRIISEIVYLIALLIVCYLIHKTKRYKNIKYILIGYLLFIIAISYKFNPVISMDLTCNKNDIVNYYSKLKSQELLNAIIYKNKHLGILLFYAIGKIGDLDLLQVSASFISYSILFYILYDYGLKNKINKRAMLIVLFFLMISIRFVFVISNVRCPIAISILTLALYWDLISNKNLLKCLPLYIISIGFHIGMLPAVVIRIIYLIMQKENNILVKFINILLFTLIAGVLIKNGNSIFDSISDKMNYYLPTNHYFSYYNYILMITRFIFIIFNIYIFKKINWKNQFLSKKYLGLFTLILIFNLISITQYTVFERYSLLLTYLSVPLLLKNYDFILNNKEKKSLTKYEFIGNVLIILIFIASFAFSDMKLLNFF